MTKWPLHFNRRSMLKAGISLPAAFALPARANSGPRIATLDWAILETLLALDANLVAATELIQFAEIAVTPAVPASVADIGLRGTPNLEVVRMARPDIIFNSNFYGWANDRLEAIAPVESYSIFVPGERPYGLAEKMTVAIGERIGRQASANAFVRDASNALSGMREQIGGAGGRPVIPINLGDTRHFRVFGADSMFGEVLMRLGLANAWQQPTSYSAMAPVGIETLALLPDAWIAVIEPVPPDAENALLQGPFWNALPAVRAGRVLRLASVNPFGALPSAMRFAHLLTDALLRVERN